MSMKNEILERLFWHDIGDQAMEIERIFLSLEEYKAGGRPAVLKNLKKLIKEGKVESFVKPERWSINAVVFRLTSECRRVMYADIKGCPWILDANHDDWWHARWPKTNTEALLRLKQAA